MLNVETLKLGKGSHDKGSGQACVMELASFLAHEPWSDSPACTSPVIASFLRAWNDALDDEERQMLKPYAAKVIGTAAPQAVELRRGLLAIDWLIREYTPAWLDLANLKAEAEAIRSLSEITADPETVKKAQPKITAAWDAAGAAARAAAWDAAGAAARAAAGAAARAAAWAAARDAARAAAGAAARAAAGADAGAAARKKLEPTKKELQASALRLLDRMIAQQ